MGNTIRQQGQTQHTRKAAPPQPKYDMSLPPEQRYDDLIERAATKYGVDPALIKGIIRKESQFDPKATSGAGARGLMQMMPATARGLGVKDPTNPEQNVMAGTRYIGELLEKYDGNQELALAAYNAGPGNVAKYGGVPPFKETRDYIPKVLGFAQEFRSDFAKNDTTAVPGERFEPTMVGTSGQGDKLSSLSFPNFAQMLAGFSQPAPSSSFSFALPWSMQDPNRCMVARHNAVGQQQALSGWSLFA